MRDAELNSLLSGILDKCREESERAGRSAASRAAARPYPDLSEAAAIYEAEFSVSEEENEAAAWVYSGPAEQAPQQPLRQTVLPEQPCAPQLRRTRHYAPRRPRGFWGTLLLIITVLNILASVVLNGLALGELLARRGGMSVLGWYPYTAAVDIPALGVAQGELLFFHRVAGADVLREGDLILSGPVSRIGLVTAVENGRVQMKSLTPETEDAMVEQGRLLGRYEGSSAFWGAALRFAVSLCGRILLLALPLFLLFFLKPIARALRRGGKARSAGRP